MAELSGHRIFSSRRINDLISETLAEVNGLNSEITGPRPADPECEAKNQKLVDAVGEFRGRGLFFPYIGTGSGNGVYVELEDGSVKMDLINGIGIHVLGHSHPRVIQTSLKAALNDIVVQGNLQSNKEYLHLGVMLAEAAAKNSRLKHCWLTTSGSMANENALKMARQKNTPARKIVAFEKAFAGRTTMMAEVTDNPAFKQGLPDYNEILRLPFYEPDKPGSSEATLELLKQHVAENENNIAAFMFEPMQGEGGYRTAPPEFFIPMLEFCRQKGIAVWADEIQTFCRSGEMFAFERLGIGDYIDLCTVAKTAQVGATLYTSEYNPNPGLIAGTFAGSSVALACGITILDELMHGGYFGREGKIEKLHQSFVGMLNRLNENELKGQLHGAGGMGLMIGVTPFDGSKEKTTALLKQLYKNGLMTFSCGRDPYRLRFLLPAVMTEDDVNMAGEIIKKSMLELQ